TQAGALLQRVALAQVEDEVVVVAIAVAEQAAPVVGDELEQDVQRLVERGRPGEDLDDQTGGRRQEPLQRVDPLSLLLRDLPQARFPRATARQRGGEPRV